jgi:hypothetical protein
MAIPSQKVHIMIQKRYPIESMDPESVTIYPPNSPYFLPDEKRV